MPGRIRLASLGLALVLGLAMPVAAAQENEPASDRSEWTGQVALWLLVVSSVFIPLNVLKRRVIVPRLRARPVALARVAKWFRGPILWTHHFTGLLAFAAALLHAFLAGSSNVLLWGGLLLFAFLVLGGMLLRWKWAPGRVKKGAYLLHAQQGAFWAMTGLLLVGHLVLD